MFNHSVTVIVRDLLTDLSSKYKSLSTLFNLPLFDFSILG